MWIFDEKANQPVIMPDQRQIRVPFLREQIGAGDAVKAMTQAVGIRSCTPCEERRRRLNQAFVFTPWET